MPSRQKEDGMAEAKTLEQAGTETPSPGTWKLDPSHTNVGFVARHLMVTKVRGRFTDVDGEIHIGETPESSSVEVRIGAASGLLRSARQGSIRGKCRDDPAGSCRIALY